MKKPLIILGALLFAVVTAGLLGSALTSTSSNDSHDSHDSMSLDADGGADSGGAEPAPAAALTDSDASAEGASTRATTQVREPAVIRTGSIGIGSDHLLRDLSKVRAVATGLKGTVGSENSQQFDGGTQAELVLRVPNASFDAAMDKLQAIGEVTHREISTADVTTEVIDVEARVRAQQASVASLQRLMGKARTVGEVMTVERELAQRQGELDSLLQQQRYLADQTSMSTIVVSLSDDPEAVEEADAGFLSGLDAGWSALGSLLTGAATFTGLVLPFVPLLLLIGAPVWLVVRRRRRMPAAA